MPITQDRFLTVIDAAIPIVELMRNLRRAIKQSSELMSNANSVLDHAEDEATRKALQGLIGQVTMIYEMTVANDEALSALEVAVKTERKYFDRVKNENDRAAYKQRQARLNKGIVPRVTYAKKEVVFPQGYTLPVQNDFPGEVVLKTDEDLANDPDYQALLEHTKTKWKEGNNS